MSSEARPDAAEAFRPAVRAAIVYSLSETGFTVLSLLGRRPTRWVISTGAISMLPRAALLLVGRRRPRLLADRQVAVGLATWIVLNYLAAARRVPRRSLWVRPYAFESEMNGLASIVLATGGRSVLPVVPLLSGAVYVASAILNGEPIRGNRALLRSLALETIWPTGAALVTTFVYQPMWAIARSLASDAESDTAARAELVRLETQLETYENLQHWISQMAARELARIRRHVATNASGARQTELTAILDRGLAGLQTIVTEAGTGIGVEGILAALRAEAWTYGIAFEWSLPEDWHPTPQHAELVTLTAGIGLANVRHHSGARNVLLEVSAGSSDLNILLSDDEPVPAGMWPNPPAHSLAILEQHVRGLGGRLDLGRVAAGTQLRLRVPMAR